MRLICLWLSLLVAAQAQIQLPPEIGELPPGMRMPRREPLPVSTVTGQLRRVDAKSVVVEPDDKRIITVYLDGKTLFDRASARPGDTVSVSANVKDGTWTAVEIKLVSSGSAKDKQRAAAPLPPTQYDDDAPAPKEQAAERSSTKPDAPEPKVRTAPATTTLPPDTEERPRLTRGRPAGAAKAEPETVVARASLPPVGLPTPPPPPVENTPTSTDAFLDRARQTAASYVSTLPNFVARQFTTRYERQPRGDFQPQDQIECEVLVENGQERYRDFKKHGRSIKRPDGDGAWTSGEFRSLQSMVLENMAAVFFNKSKETIARRETIRYQFTVPKDASHWRVYNASQVYLPAYSGTIWLDAESARVVRIEIESRGIPEGFPTSKVETTLDYDFITLAGQKYLLPVSAAALACEAATKICSKNEIQFRHYRAFTAESKISFEEAK